MITIAIRFVCFLIWLGVFTGCKSKALADTVIHNSLNYEIEWLDAVNKIEPTVTNGYIHLINRKRIQMFCVTLS